MPESSASLENLRDIAVPEAPSLWPPAPGIWVLMVIASAVVAALVLWWWRARARNAYRRAGLALLENAKTTRQVNVILKRVALAVFPRPKVAPLFGDAWVTFLDGTCPRTKFASLGVSDPDDAPSRDMVRKAHTWIRHHRASVEGRD